MALPEKSMSEKEMFPYLLMEALSAKVGFRLKSIPKTKLISKSIGG
jgi:hypothetical protein